MHFLTKDLIQGKGVLVLTELRSQIKPLADAVMEDFRGTPKDLIRKQSSSGKTWIELQRIAPFGFGIILFDIIDMADHRIRGLQFDRAYFDARAVIDPLVWAGVAVWSKEILFEELW